MYNVVLDTNFLMIPFQFKIDIFKELDRILDDNYKLFILEDQIDELNNIINNQKKDKNNAKLALEYIRIKNINILKQKDLYITNFSKTNKVDDILVYISKDDYIVATSDKELKKRIKENKKKIITLRSKSYLSIE